MRLLVAKQLDKPIIINMPNILLEPDLKYITSRNFPMEKLIVIVETEINKPPKNKIFELFLKL